MTTTTNGMRKTLASQLDRLDSILDGLSDGLNEAVATAVEGAVGRAVEMAVRQAVGEAVRETLQAVIAEVVSNPDLLAAARTLLTPGTAADVPSDNPTTPPERPRGLFQRTCDGVKAGLGAAATACSHVVGQAAGVKAVARGGWQLAKQFRGRVLAACGVGVAAGAVTLLAAPWLGVAAASVVGFCGTLAVKARDALRGLFAPAPAFA
jgi:hypothetical protein